MWISCVRALQLIAHLVEHGVEVITNSAEVPGVTFSRTSLMNLSSIPTSVSAPVEPGRRADGRAQQRDEEDEAEQQAPERPAHAPAPARLCSWRVFGFLRSAGQRHDGGVVDLDQLLVCRRSSVESVRSAPSAVGNLRTVKVAICPPGSSVIRAVAAGPIDTSSGAAAGAWSPAAAASGSGPHARHSRDLGRRSVE